MNINVCFAAIALFGMVTATARSQDNSKQEELDSKTVAIVKVKAPWYGFDFLITKRFKDAIPLYEKLDGLIFKAFSINENEAGKNFGGIYLWATKEKALHWYTPKWFKEVEEKRGAVPTVNYYRVIEDLQFPQPGFSYAQEETESVAVQLDSLSSEDARKLLLTKDGLFRAYLLADSVNQHGLILFFTTEGTAEAFLKTHTIKKYQWFKTPVLLNNEK